MMRRSRRGQSVVEWMLGVSVIVVGIAAGFMLFGEGVRGAFDTARTTVQQPYP